MQSTLPDFDGLIHWDRLNEWLSIRDLPGKGPVTEVHQLTGGTQNNLFLMHRQGGSFVLRRPPLHLRRNSNDTMLREARVLRSLAGSSVPHPRYLAVCDDVSIIGSCFYLMEPIEGFSPRGPLPGRYATESSWRAAMGAEFVKASAALSKIDHVAAGLADFGKPDDWHARQVGRWRNQLESYNQLPGYPGSALPHVDEVCKWLGDNLPRKRLIGIIHGDFQFTNAMFSMEAPIISGMIDWELSSLGDPLLDLAWTLARWVEPDDPEGLEPFIEPWQGFMTTAEMAAMYGEITGRDMTELAWFRVLAGYKMGCVFEGSYARALAGQAPMATGERLHRSALWLLRKALQIAQKA
jgi:aminoglycoside phosphotransferase (APT) family kinase protein